MQVAEKGEDPIYFDGGGACGMVKGGEVLQYVWRREGFILGNCQSFISNGAWVADSSRGAAAWVHVGAHRQEVMAQVELCFASSAALVEVQASLATLWWASVQGFPKVCIQTNSSIFAHGLCNPQGAAASLQLALKDFCFLCSFNYVKIVKVSRLVAKASHRLVVKTTHNRAQATSYKQAIDLWLQQLIIELRLL
ncbi:hypothetical protein RHMOL_Rhmol01G0174900 [Rhododendron molle]|uniref:Uncharacterized protein n=1 Tax=Rhododendron molle TaxID=49168 RepID=A0ACC0Q4E6_RHOML|nr:hypothetical protein RHMOL_Rhmol01G0174900 [Rhododendron molle]